MKKKELKVVAKLVVEAVKREMPKIVRKEVQSVVKEMQQPNNTAQNGRQQQADEFTFMNENNAIADTSDIEEADDPIQKALQHSAQNPKNLEAGGGMGGAVGNGVVNPSQMGYGDMSGMTAGAGNFDSPDYGFQGMNQQQMQQQQQGRMQQPQRQPQQPQQPQRGGKQQINAQQAPQQQAGNSGQPQVEQQPQQSQGQMPSFIQNAANKAKNVVDQSKQHDGGRRSFMPNS